MTDREYTHWTLVVDRSGSMQGVKDDAQGGINKAFDEQRALPGRLTLALYQFDTEIDLVVPYQDITTVGTYTLIPRNMTALLDAVGKAITETGEYLAKMPEERRPANVLVTIVTDGLENSSQEWTLEQVRELIKRQQDTYKWIVAFIGAGDTAWMGRDIGTYSVSTYTGTKSGTQAAYDSASASLVGLRSAGVYIAPEVIDDPGDK